MADINKILKLSVIENVPKFNNSRFSTEEEKLVVVDIILSYWNAHSGLNIEWSKYSSLPIYIKTHLNYSYFVSLPPPSSHINKSTLYPEDMLKKINISYNRILSKLLKKKNNKIIISILGTNFTEGAKVLASFIQDGSSVESEQITYRLVARQLMSFRGDRNHKHGQEMEFIHYKKLILFLNPEVQHLASFFNGYPNVKIYTVKRKNEFRQRVHTEIDGELIRLESSATPTNPNPDIIYSDLPRKYWPKA
jgi:hypothetical protein